MGVIIEDIRITNEFTTETTNYLLGNVGDKVTIEVDFRAEEVFVTGAEADVDRILLAPQPYRVNVANSKDVIYCENLESFTNYRVGDTLSFYNDSSMATFSYQVYEKLSDSSLRVHTIGGSAGDVDFYAANGSTYDTSLPINSYIYITTDLTAINYRWNLIGNDDSDTYINKIDEQLNQAKASGVDNTDTITQVPLVFDLPKTHHIGSAYVVGNGSTTTSQKFTIVHETYITPFLLPGDLNDLEDRIAPDYFDEGNALKYIVSIDVGRNSNDPNYIQTEQSIDIDGNTGWFDENFNGNPNEYYINSVVYKRADLTTIDAVELTTNEQIVEVIVKNDSGPFSNNNTEFTFNFSIIPNEQDDVIGNGQTIIENFYFDRAFNTVGSAAVNGDNYTTNQQIIKEVSATYTSATEIKITATLALSSAALTDLASRADLNYLLFVSTQDHTLETEESDRVALIADIQPFFLDVSDDGLITFDAKFLRHYESDVDTEGTTTPIVRTEDDVLTYTKFYIDRLGRETDEILIDSVECALVAKKTDGSEFDLESFSQSFNGTLVVNDTQYIDNTIDRVFKMPDNDQRKQIKIKRRIDLDTTDLRYYEIYYPFLMRWEYWESLSDVNSDAFDTSLANNGQNEDWQRYDTLADWDIYYRTKINVLKNGNLLSYTNDTQLTTFDYLEDTDWTNEIIEAFDADTLTSLGTLLVSPCKIVASFDYIGVNQPALNDVEFVMRIETYEQGGINDIRFFSSVYDWSENSWFSSTDTSNKLVKSYVGSTYKCEALIDFSELPDNAQFKISARVYNESALTPETCYILDEAGNPITDELGNYLTIESCGVAEISGKLMEDGTLKLMEDGTTKIEEN